MDECGIATVLGPFTNADVLTFLSVIAIAMAASSTPLVFVVVTASRMRMPTASVTMRTTVDVNQNGTCDDEETGDDCLHDSDDDGIVDCEDPCPYGDFDQDGICDEEDPCVGVVDVLGICNGHCFFNVDGDLICDDVDNCIDTTAATTTTLPTVNVKRSTNVGSVEAMEPSVAWTSGLQLRCKADCDDEFALTPDAQMKLPATTRLVLLATTVRACTPTRR